MGNLFNQIQCHVVTSAQMITSSATGSLCIEPSIIRLLEHCMRFVSECSAGWQLLSYCACVKVTSCVGKHESPYAVEIVKCILKNCMIMIMCLITRILLRKIDSVVWLCVYCRV